jgi:glycosyltransferase involved in cell wall biosynthesis
MIGYCINLRSEEYKFEETKIEMLKLGLDLIRVEVEVELYPRITRSEVDPSNKSNGILNSHLKLLKHLKTLQDDYFLILEDDVIVLNNKNINSIINSAPKDWDVIFLGGMNHFQQPSKFNSEFYKPIFSFNAHSYIVKSTFLDTLINRVEIRDFELDVIFAHMQSNGVGNWYGVVDDILIQHGKYSYTSIKTFGDNYKKIKRLNRSRILLKEISPIRDISKKEIFEDICRKQLKFIENKWPLIDKNSKLKSLIVESRFGEHIEFTIKNTIQKLGDGWGHIIVCTNNNVKQITKISNDISKDIEIVNLGDFIITRNSYNNLCLSLKFWDLINCEKVFVYQSDTYIFKEFDNSFLEFDYIGAPWGPSEHSKNTVKIFLLEKEICVGNGGLSLRTVSAMKKILQQQENNKNSIEYNKVDCDFIWEDLFFSYYIEMSDEFKLAPVEIAKKFSFEHYYSDDSFGCHQPYLNSFSGEDLFERFLDRIGGVNVLGFANYFLGLGHNMRVIVEALNKAKIPHNINELRCDSTKSDFFKVDDFNYFNTNLILCNPDYEFLSIVGKNYINGKKNIALWAWELEALPKKWIQFSENFDEIWSQSEFCKDCFQKSLPSKKIELINIKGDFRIPNTKEESKKRLGLDNKFIVSFIFDGNSDRIRKNPEGVIYAFDKYLSKFDDCVLFLKCHNLKEVDIEILSQLCKEKNKIFINDGWSNEQMTDLISSTDIYVSLHRSEGSGLTIMESIYLGIPTVTTNWSGNLDFCKPEFCELVDYEMISISPDSNYYSENKTAEWVEPDFLQASQKMLNIYNNYNYYKERALRGRKFIEEKYNIDTLTDFLKNKFKK